MEEIVGRILIMHTAKEWFNAYTHEPEKEVLSTLLSKEEAIHFIERIQFNVLCEVNQEIERLKQESFNKQMRINEVVIERDALKAVAAQMAESLTEHMMRFLGHAKDCPCSQCESLQAYTVLLAGKPVADKTISSDFYNGIEWFACWLLDHVEGETITEEQLRPWVVKAWSAAGGERYQPDWRADAERLARAIRVYCLHGWDNETRAISSDALAAHDALVKESK